MHGNDGKQLLLKSTQAYKVWVLHVKCYYNTNKVIYSMLRLKIN